MSGLEWLISAPISWRAVAAMIAAVLFLIWLGGHREPPDRSRRYGRPLSGYRPPPGDRPR